MDIRRRSPVRLPATPVRFRDRDGWRVIREYENEAAQNRLIDLSHRPRWDVQGPDPAEELPPPLAVPQEPGDAVFAGDFLVIRLNRTQAAVWQLRGEAVAKPAPALTEITEATMLLALSGPSTAAILEKLTALDTAGPALVPPCVLQGPLGHVTVQLAVLHPGGAFLIAAPRGYARYLTAAVLQAGKPFDLRPAGEAAFESFVIPEYGAQPEE